jgi:hypothetical protein
MSLLTFSVNIAENEGDACYSTSVTSVATGAVMQLMVTVAHAEDRLFKTVVLIKDMKDIEAIHREIAVVEREIGRMRTAAIPIVVADKLDAYMEFTARNCLIIAIDMYDFDRFSRGRTPAGMAAQMRAFYSAIEIAILEQTDVLKIRNLGVMGIVCFNLLQTYSDMTGLVGRALDFCMNVAAKLKEERIEARFGMAIAETVKAGMISADRLTFDIYAPVVQSVTAYARRAQVGTVIFPVNLADFLSPEDRLRVVEVKMSMGMIAKDAVFILKLDS